MRGSCLAARLSGSWARPGPPDPSPRPSWRRPSPLRSAGDAAPLRSSGLWTRLGSTDSSPRPPWRRPPPLRSASVVRLGSPVPSPRPPWWRSSPLRERAVPPPGCTAGSYPVRGSCLAARLSGPWARLGSSDPSPRQPWRQSSLLRSAPDALPSPYPACRHSPFAGLSRRRCPGLGPPGHCAGAAAQPPSPSLCHCRSAPLRVAVDEYCLPQDGECLR